jgi:hypothetical protein
MVREEVRVAGKPCILYALDETEWNKGNKVFRPLRSVNGCLKVTE